MAHNSADLPCRADQARPDGELQRLSVAAAGERRSYEAQPLPDDESDRRIATVFAGAWAVVQHPATAPEDLAVKAATALDVLVFLRAPPDIDKLGEDEDEEIRLAAAVLRQVAEAGRPIDAAALAADADLILDCQVFSDLARRTHAIRGFSRAADAERDRLGRRQTPLAARIVAATAITPAGHAARAQALMFWEPELVGFGSGDLRRRLLHALLRDLAGPEAVAEVRSYLGIGGASGSP